MSNSDGTRWVVASVASRNARSYGRSDAPARLRAIAPFLMCLAFPVSPANAQEGPDVPARTAPTPGVHVEPHPAPPASPGGAAELSPSPGAPDIAPVDQEKLVPRVTPSPTRRPLVWIGATVFSLAYMASALAATTSYLSDTDVTTPHGSLWIPVVGPFIDMGTTSGAGNEIALALDALAQIGGLTMFVYGQTLPKATPTVGTSGAADEGAHRVAITVAPFVTRDASGAAVFGRF